MIKHCYETERSVLGTLITLGDYNSPDVQKAMLVLTEDCFYKPESRALFRILRRCYEKKESLSLVAVLDYLSKKDESIYQYVESVMKDSYYGKAQLAPRVENLVTLSTLRDQVQIMQTTLNLCAAEPLPNEAANILREGIGEIGRVKLSKAMQGSTMEEITNRYFDDYYAANSLVKTNVFALDLALQGGMANQSLVTVCGDSGVGKTFFSLYLMRMITQSIADKQSLFFSLEMGEHKIWERLISIVGKKQKKDMNFDELAQAITKLYSHKTTIFEEQFKDIATIETICRVHALEKPLAVVIVDYLTLVESKGKFDRHDLKQSDITKRLASLAMELDCIVIALSQANREVSKRDPSDRCPYPQDAADSSGSFRSSTLWFGIDRPELHDNEPSLKNKFVANCRKNRYGEPFEVVWAFDGGIFNEVDQYNHFKKPLAEVISNPFDYGRKRG